MLTIFLFILIVSIPYNQMQRSKILQKKGCNELGSSKTPFWNKVKDLDFAKQRSQLHSLFKYPINPYLPVSTSRKIYFLDKSIVHSMDNVLCMVTIPRDLSRPEEGQHFGIASQFQRCGLNPELIFFVELVCSLLPTWVSSGCSGFLPIGKDELVCRLISNYTFPLVFRCARTLRELRGTFNH